MESKLTALAVAIVSAAIAFAAAMAYMHWELKDLRADAFRRDQQLLDARTTVARSDESMRLLREELAALAGKVATMERGGQGQGFEALAQKVEAALARLDGRANGGVPPPGLPFGETPPAAGSFASKGAAVRYAVLPVGDTTEDALVDPPDFQAGLVRIIQASSWARERDASAVAVDVSEPLKHWSRGMKEGKLQRTVLAADGPTRLDTAMQLVDALPEVFGEPNREVVFCVKGEESEHGECKNLDEVIARDLETTKANLLIYLGNRMVRFSGGTLRGYQDALNDLDKKKRKKSD